MKHSTSSRCTGSYAAQQIAVELKFWRSKKAILGLPFGRELRNSHFQPTGNPAPATYFAQS